jgi:CP family cyanate transporter-like MFS transporter
VQRAAPGIELILLLTVVIGAGMGVAVVLLPRFVKRYASSHPATATGLYVSGTIIGSSLTLWAAVPLALTFGGWRGALLGFGVVISALAVLWMLLTDAPEGRARVPLTLPRFPWRKGAAWLLVLLFMLQSLLFFGLVTWLAPALIERGWEPTAAGAVAGAFNFSALPGSLLITVLGDRVGRQSAFVAASAATLVAYAGLAVSSDLTLLWVVVGGVGLGAIFALVMTLPLDAADRPQEAGQYSAMMLGAGYGLSAAAPAVLGGLRDSSGSFTSSLWILAATAVVMLGGSLLVGRIPRQRAQHRAPAHT